MNTCFFMENTLRILFQWNGIKLFSTTFSTSYDQKWCARVQVLSLQGAFFARAMKIKGGKRTSSVFVGCWFVWWFLIAAVNPYRPQETYGITTSQATLNGLSNNHTHTSKRNKKSPFPFGSSMKMCRPIVKPGYDERDHKNNAPSKTMTMMESWRLLSTKNNFYNRNSAIHLSITSACSYTTLTKSKKKNKKWWAFEIPFTAQI